MTMMMNIIVIGFSCILRSKGKKVVPLVDYVLNVVGLTFLLSPFATNVK